MQSNPFAPPQAARLEVAHRRRRKPMGVWVVQALLLLIGGFIARDLVQGVLDLMGPWVVAWPGQLISIGLEGLILAWAGVAMIGAEFRQGFARWMALVFLLLASGLVTYVSLFVDPQAKPSEAPFDHGMGTLSLAIGLAVVGWLGFGTQAKAWFRVEPGQRSSDGIA